MQMASARKGLHAYPTLPNGEQLLAEPRPTEKRSPTRSSARLSRHVRAEAKDLTSAGDRSDAGRVKIALIRRQFSGTGGAELYLDRLIEALAGAGHDLHLFTERWPGKGPGVTTHPVPISGTRASRPQRFAEAVDLAVNPSEFDVVFSLERTVRQDVYRAGDGVHRSWLDQRRRFAPWWKRPWIGRSRFHASMLELEAKTFDPSRTGCIIVNSNMVADDIAVRFQYPRDRMHCVRNGVRVAPFDLARRVATRRKLGIGEGERVVLFAGSGWERKGLGFLLRSFAEWNNAETRLIVVGKGTPPRAEQPRVLFTGPVDSVADYYSAADLFVFLPIYEPSANVVFEALAAGLPVITTRSNGASEVMREEIHGAVLDDPSDLAAVTGALRKWIDKPRLPRNEIDKLELGIERNVRETMAILERAREDRRATRLS